MSRTMQLLGLVEIDLELTRRTTELDAITNTMLELDKHPGLTLVRRYPPSGVTAARWLPVRDALALMWEDLGRMRAILDSARTVRGTRAKLDDAQRAELTELLRGRSYEVSRTPIPLAERSLTGPSEHVLFVGLADTVDRMRASFPPIAEFLDAVDQVNTRVMSGLAPLQETLDKAGAATPELRAIGDGIAELLSCSATDPLALTNAEIDARLAELGDALRRQAAILAEFAALAANRPAAVAALRTRLAELVATVARAARAKAEVERTIRSGPLPQLVDESARLRGELDAVAAESGAAALPALRGRIDRALAAAAAAENLAQGLLDRRAELRGRLAAYHAKAARLGVSEDRDLLAAHETAAALLSGKPCDLAAVTRAVADYQQLVAAKSGRRS
ncbi:hypothetical protein [Nocardia brasiliensis]|uniref:Uncharacterized protein n=1 Tax=Nocardia brasiliensis (strain ATCC 700358 / HUJEG-1) TaxID=1133849 RepID=K0F1Y6_NOCB7|nr:hypothetical protein [Nocardia brasiliensis]AFU03125.1 hypothetical protein O3I_025880 [Nocardia brasiliensis ATCC 700358]OCF86993.1 hypothetical protein AW168_29115 [Nocardia brasiliensis]